MSKSVTDKIEEFFARYRPQVYSKGQVVIFNDEEVQKVFFVDEGKVVQCDITGRGDEIIMNIFKPGAFFPMSMAINGGASPYVYRAETDVLLRLAPVSDVIEFIKANPDILYDLLSRVYRGVDGLLSRMSFLMSGSARNRLIHEIVIESKRFGLKHDDGTVTLEIKEKDLGSRAGLSRETVSREINKLKSAGLIEINSKHIVVPKLKLLESSLVEEN